MKALASSDGAGTEAPSYDWRQDPDYAPFLTPEVVQLSARLAGSADLPPAEFDPHYRAVFESGRALIIGQDAYGPVHKERFREMFSACVHLLDGRPSPRVLEFGTSEFSAIFQMVLPDLVLDLSDRPAADDYVGFTETVARRLTRCDRYLPIDLTGGARAVAEANVRPASYDLIVLAEVLEHVTVNPVELIGALLALVRPDGWLYLSAPNFLRRANLDLLARFENPQEVYPPGDGNWDGHHHHREPTAKELLRFVAEAGGRPAAFYYSASGDLDPGLPEHERGTLVVVARPGSGDDDA